MRCANRLLYCLGQRHGGAREVAMPNQEKTPPEGEVDAPSGSGGEISPPPFSEAQLQWLRGHLLQLRQQIAQDLRAEVLRSHAEYRS